MTGGGMTATELYEIFFIFKEELYEMKDSKSVGGIMYSVTIMVCG